MANERFKVKFGLAVGDTAATIDATSGDIYTTGDLQIDGNTIKKSGGTPVIEFSGTNLTTLAGDLEVDGNSIRSSTGAVAIEMTGPNISTGDITVGQNGYIYSSTGLALDLTGQDVAVQGDLAVLGGDITTTQTTANIVNATATTVNIAGAATTVSIGANTGTTTINNSLVADDISILTVDATNIEVSNIKAKDGTAAMTIADGTGAVTVSSSLQVDNIDIRNNTISSTNTDGDITLLPNGIGRTAITRLSTTSPRITTSIDDTNGNELLLLTATGSAVNELTLANAATGNSPTITASGADTNVGLNIVAKGTGNIALNTADGGNVVASRNFVDGAIRNANTQARGNIWEALATTPPTAPTAPYSGISIDNSLDTTKLAGAVLRNYGAAATSRARLIFERSRGTAASPSAVLQGDFLGEVDVTGYTTAGWLNDLVAAVPAFYGFNATENWTGSANCGTQLTIALQPTATQLATGTQIPCIVSSPQNLSLRGDVFSIAQGKTAAFVATGCSTSGTTLTIGTVTSGTVAVGQQVQTATNAIPFGTYIVANISGSGSGSTWQLSNPLIVTSAQTVTGNTGFIGSPSAATTVDALQNLRLLRNTIQGSTGTTQIVTSAAGATLELRGDNIQLETAAGTNIVGSSITYNRVYGQWQYNTLVTPVAANTAYVFPLGTPDFNNIATVGSTSRLIPGAAGMYNFQFSVQINNADNGSEHFAYIWLRKNGTDVPASMGRVGVVKNGDNIASWNYLIDPANATDYFELAYAVDSTQITFPTYAATAFGPSTAALITTLTPVGA